MKSSTKLTTLLAIVSLSGCASNQESAIPAPPLQPQSVGSNAQSIDSAFLLSPSDKRVIQRQAESGDQNAAFRLSFHFMSAGDNARAKYWQMVAAENGHPVAQYNQWFDLRNSKDCVSVKQALAWLERSAEGGFQDAKNALADYSRKAQLCAPFE